MSIFVPHSSITVLKRLAVLSVCLSHTSSTTFRLRAEVIKLCFAVVFLVKHCHEATLYLNTSKRPKEDPASFLRYTFCAPQLQEEAQAH